MSSSSTPIINSNANNNNTNNKSDSNSNSNVSVVLTKVHYTLGVLAILCLLSFSLLSSSSSSASSSSTTTQLLKLSVKKGYSEDKDDEVGDADGNKPLVVTSAPALSSSSSSSSSSSQQYSSVTRNINCNCTTQIKRYEPSPWRRGQRFPNGVTPLTMIKSKTVPTVELPPDWDGGYGWVFVKYHPSAYELRWRKESAEVEKITAGTPLCTLRNERFAEEQARYDKEHKRFPPDSGGIGKCNKFTIPDEPMKFDDEIFSRFEYVYKCTRPPCNSPPPASGPKIGDKKYSYIEPLVGLLRHPKACGHRNFKQLVSKNYMIIDPWPLWHVSRSTISPSDPKIVFVDGGASTWNKGLGGASQSWFNSVYESLCLFFTDFFMYEASKLDAKKVYKQLPGHLKPGYRWMNIFLRTEPTSWDNPINTLLIEAKKEDVVIFKIDFDSAEVEMALLQLILDHPEVSELVDELYFEHHVQTEIMKRYWKTDNIQVYHSDSLKLFTALRERGIRAHSWV